jgi:DNA polymerase III delta prime subunit
MRSLGLVSDRALRPGEQDRFAHDDFVDELEELIRSGIDTANIALYGPWGAGKSGIAHRLKARFLSKFDREHFRFVEFNAFKYAETPLLRNFIYRIAEAATPDGAKRYKKRLYEHGTHSEIRVPGGWKAVAWTFAAIVGIVLVVDLLLLALLHGEAREITLDVTRALLPSALPIGVVVAAAPLVLPYFTADTQAMAPSSAEEFEELFRTLVRDDLKISGEDDKRLVVFIDELDRCSAAQVAESLETLRTFVNIPGCVFIVAADQRVLEHALSQRVRQSTPPDTVTPYYSGGSAYLDKIFEYQLALPALLPSRLVDFAAASVANVGGPWKELDDLYGVLSVLIPVHVQSPRRVKVLLNRFVLTYAVAKKRVGAGSLQGDISGRAQELAKLVCLRTEFPLFAHELERDFRICQAVLAYSHANEDGTDPEDVDVLRFDPELRRRARAIVSGRQPVDELLIDKRVTHTTADDPTERAQAEDSDREADVVCAQAAQLIDYLDKTKAIEGPNQDLINLEGGGAVFGVDPAFAREVETAALNNQARRVLAAIDRRSEEEGARALLVLGALLRRSRGNDADNVTRSLLRACTAVGAALAGVASQLIRDLEETDLRIEVEEIPGAFDLAVMGQSRSMVTDLIERNETLTDPRVRRKVLRLAPSLHEHAKRLGEVATRELTHDDSKLAEILGEIPEDTARLVAAAAVPHVEELISERAASADPDADSDAANPLDALAGSIEALALGLAGRDRKRAGEQMLIPLVAGGRDLLWGRQERVQEALAPISSEPVVALLLSDIPTWSPGRWPALLATLDPEVLARRVTSAVQDRWATRWWLQWRESDSTDDAGDLEGALDAITCLKDINPEAATAEIDKAVAEGLGGPVQADGLSKWEHLLTGAAMLADAHLVSASVPADGAMLGIARLVASELPVDASAGELAPQVVDIAGRYAAQATTNALHEVLAAVGQGAWLQSPQRETLILIANGALPPADRGAALGVDDLVALRRDHGVDSYPAIGLWLAEHSPAAVDAVQLLAPWVSEGVPSAVAGAVRTYAENLSPAALTALAVLLTRDALHRAPSREVLASLRYDEADDQAIATELLALDGRASNFEGRKTILELWEALQPRHAPARKLLILDVLIPMLSHGAQTYDLVRRHLKLAADPPHGTKAQLVTALIDKAPDKKRRGKMEVRMSEVGLRARRKRFGII